MVHRIDADNKIGLVPVFAHDAIHNINCVHEKHGICLNCKKVSDYKNESPCIIISPLLSARNQFRFGLKSLGFKSIAFSGWSLLSDFGKRLGVDHAFPLSDHADFNELLLTVKKCNPKRVFTHHGFAGEFAEFLRLEGFDAKVI